MPPQPFLTFRLLEVHPRPLFTMASADLRPPSALWSPSTEQSSATETYFLPDNPPPHLTPSLTHQPELLLLQGLLDCLANVVNQILNHPTINSPIPDNTLFTDTDAFRLYFQYHESVTELARITLRLKRASRLLQFVPGPPGHQGSYRVNPSTHFPPDTTDFLADEVHIFHPTPPRHHRPRPNRHRQLPPPGPAARDRSRSRDSSAS